MDIDLIGTALIDQVAKRTGLTKKTVRQVWLESLSVMQDVLLAKGTVQLRNIGRLSVRQMPKRNYYDINTDSIRTVEGHDVLAVRISRALRDQLEAMPQEEFKNRQIYWNRLLASYHQSSKQQRSK